MKKYLFQIISTLVIVLLLSLLFKKEAPEIIEKTTIEYITVTDTIEKTIIKEVPRIVYVKDTTQEGSPEIKANEYETTIKSEDSFAELKIITTGRLLDVKGFITHQDRIERTELTRFTQKSAFFLYGETSITPALEHFEIGLDYVIKNKVLIGLSGSYNSRFQYGSINLKFGFKL